MSAEYVQAPRVKISVDQIPEVKGPLPVFSLGASVMAPEPFMQRAIQAVAPKAKFSELGSSGARAAYADARMVAFVHPGTGESMVFPLLESLQPVAGLGQRAAAISRRLVGDAALFPADGTRVSALPPVTLLGSRHMRTGDRTAPGEYLSFVRFQRRIDELPVFGPGTRAMIAVAGDDSIRSFSHRWRTATRTDASVAPRPRAEIARTIAAHLASSARTATATVDAVRLGYYDGGKSFLQPVYRFEATLAFPDGKLHAANRHVLGYVSVGDAVEPLPVLNSLRGALPAEPVKSAQGSPQRGPATAVAGDPLVGRYVVRNDSSEWVTSANEFMGGLALAQGLFGGPIPFTDSQYYWAEPFEFVADKDAFVNNVHIALTEVHGNWGLFSTRDNADDLVRLTDIPATGYGAAGGGSLAYWILHSCEVIPTQTDEATSFDVWWNIFNGLHAVVGYRTEMWIDDDVAAPFGLVMGLGAPVVGAWLNTVASDDAYDDGATYHDGNRNIDEPMGRASAVAVCGHSDDTANDVASAGRAECLTEWWFNN